MRSAIVQDLVVHITWYKDFVERGAAEHGLPEDYENRSGNYARQNQVSIQILNASGIERAKLHNRV